MSWAIGSATTRPIASDRWRRIERAQHLADPFQGLFHGLALGGADRHGLVDPLAEELRVAATDLLDLEALPEPLIKVAQVVQPLRAEADRPANRLGGAHNALAGAAVQGDQVGSGNLLGERDHLGAAALAQGMSRTPWTRFCSS